LLLYVEPYNREKVTTALAGLQRVPFGFENKGSSIVFYRE